MRLLLIVALFLLVSFSISPVFAHDPFSSPSSLVITPVPTLPVVEKVKYELPYPGILPDNPLYILKAARDRMISFLISDPLKKAEFNLLTSDKRFYAAKFLLDKKKDVLAVSTLSKGNNYFDQSLNQLKVAATFKRDVKPLLERMKLSIQKHKEMMVDLEKQIGKNEEDNFKQEQKKLEEFENRIDLLWEK